MPFDTSYSSPNWSPRSGRPIGLLVLHATAASGRNALKWLVSPLSQTSAHYLIERSGRIYQLVPDDRAAWHAERSVWRGSSEVDDIAIGIELEHSNSGPEPYPDAQLMALLELTRELVERYNLRPEQVVLHAEIALPRGSQVDPLGFPIQDFLAALFPGQRLAPRPPFPLSQLASPSLADALREAAYRQAGLTYRPTWAVFRAATRLALGAPVGEGFQIAAEDGAYLVQPFARDVLFTPLGDWDSVGRLSYLRDNPEAAGLYDTLLQALFQQAGASYHADWPFHQIMEREVLGPPLLIGSQLALGGSRYVAEVYALDTLYAQVGVWYDIRRLSVLQQGMFDRRGQQPGAEEQALRDELLALLYRRVGATFHPEWPLHQRALQWGLGAPLARAVRYSAGGRDYIAQPYALDTLYTTLDEWMHVEGVDTRESG